MRTRAVLLVLLASCATTPAPSSPRCDDVTAYADEGSVEDAARRFVADCALDATVELTAELVRFPTVRAKEGKDGPAFVAMRDHLKKWSEAHGFTFEDFDGDPWVVSWGDGEPSVAFVLHADVVPVVEDGVEARPRIPNGWTKPAFEVVREDGRLYGRGTEDDKGPIASVLHTMMVLSKLGYRPHGKIQAIIGTGEEHDWDGMVAYAKAEPNARFVVSVDANYPAVVAESGFVKWVLSAPLDSDTPKPKGCVEVVDAKAGQFLTQVPGDATLTLAGRPEVASTIAKRENIDVKVEEDGANTRVTVTGRAVHSSTAEDGDSALWALGALADELPLCPGGIRDLLATVAKYLDGDHFGARLGLAHDHEAMLPLLVIPTLLRVEDGRATLAVNMRRPAGPDEAAFGAMLDRALATIQREVSATIVEDEKQRYIGKPALADTDGPLVTTLLEIYREASGDEDAAPVSIRGGTYARLFPGAVSFGPAIPGREYRGHAPDEFLEEEALQLMNTTLLEALLRLDAIGRPPAPRRSSSDQPRP